MEYGNAFNFCHLLVDLQSIGRVAMIVGRGVVLIFGEADRGPGLVPFYCASASEVVATYKSGDIAEGGQLAFVQGADLVVGFRVMGTGYATAFLDVEDGLGNVVGTFRASSDGLWGNIPIIKISQGSLMGTHYQTFHGTDDQSVGPYALEKCNLIDYGANFVRVNDEDYDVVYTAQELTQAGQAYVNKSTGQVTFYAGDGLKDTDTCSVGIRYHTIKLQITDNFRDRTFDNIHSLIELNAKLRNNATVHFEIEPYMTHLPATNGDGSCMAGGADGAEPTEEDWAAAFASAMELPQGIVPTTSCIMDWETEDQEGSFNLVALYDGFLESMADIFQTHIGFTALPTDISTEEILDLVAGYNNLWMSIGANYWDSQERNLAPARAGREAAVRLGDSCGDDNNCMKGVNGLLFQCTPAERELLTSNRIDVLIKKTGIRPYVGLNTATDDNWRRCVDARTIAWCMVALKTITDRFYNRKRTKETLGQIQGSLTLVLEEERRASVLDAYTVAVTKNDSDRNRADIDMAIQPVGHLERFHAKLKVGYYSDQLAP